MSAQNQPEHSIALAMSEDQHNLRRMLRSVRESERSGRPHDRLRSRFEELLHKSMERRQRRAAWQPRLDWDPELPVAARRQEVADVIRGHQVIVLCGETGSGKSTQLPKILTEMGRGIGGIIGHTQPRRIAARSVAARVAEELGAKLGQEVGFRIRFTDSSGPNTRIRLMTDGILLAETQGDPWLSQYDTIIVDEAHERSLNIDFLLGYLKRLLPKRRDLKLIITSATIDAARFAEHFSTAGQPAPVLHIAGRTWPVEIRWRPLDEDEKTPDDTAEPRDWLDGVTDAVHEAAAIDNGHILVFLPTERDIREAGKRLGGQRFPGDTPQYPTEIVPLFGRLSMEEQTRVFSAWPHRRIVLATNVAESSLTVPGIRFVIDTGTARISRYSARSRMQRLPIEPISQASARQRSGRCGRVGPGICFRLYSEDDFNQREAFTAPEIQRTNLAAVILRTLSLRLGRLDDFPFLDPPKTAAVREGYRTLEELGAIVMENARETTAAATAAANPAATPAPPAAAQASPAETGPDAAAAGPPRRQPAPPKPGELTELGRRMARLPVDPRISRMILAAVEEHALPEVLAIAAFLETQDPRERPVDKQQAADEAHARFVNRDSDFLTILNLWDAWHEKQRSLSGSQVKKWCRQHFLSWMRMREWVDVHAQLRELLEDSDDPAVAKAAKSLSAHHRAGKQAHASPNPAAAPAPTQNAGKPHNTRPQVQANQKTARPGKPGQPGAAAPAPAEPRHNDFAATHRALLTGLLANIACQTPEGEYQSAGGGKLALWPGSALAPKGAKWFVAGELVETSRRFARTVARIQPEWIEPLADHLVTREYFEPHWDEESGNALIHEKVSLWGLPIVPRRRISLARIDPAKSRDMLIQHGLVEWGLLFGKLSDDGEDPDHGYEDEEETLSRGAWSVRPGRRAAPGRPAPRRGWGHEFPFLKHNREVLQQLRELQARTRSHHLLPGDDVLFQFYATRIPEECIDRDRLRRWYQRTHTRIPQLLQFDINQFADESQRRQHADLFPERLQVGSLTLPLTYQLDPGQEADGVTVSVPEEALGQLSESQLDWLVPGLLEQKVLATLRSLPKPLRRFFVPAPESARKAAAVLEFGKGDFLVNLAQKLTQLCGERIDPREFDRAAIPDHLQFNVRILDPSGRPILEGRDLRLLRTSLAERARSAALAADDRAAAHGPAPEEARWMRTGFRAWDFDQLPEHISIVRAGIPIRSFPALRDDGDSVALTLCQTADEASLILRRGLRRLIQLLEKKRLLTQVGNLPNANTMRMQAATIKGIDFPQHLSLLMADRSFLHDAPLPRSRPAFEKTLELGRQRLGIIAQEFTQFLPGLFQSQLDTRRQLDQTRGAGWDALLADMQRQLQGLIHPTFLIDTPWPWLIQYPRYLAAIRQRLTRLSSGGLRNELAATAELQPWLERFSQKTREHQQQRRTDPLLLHFRWMLEEFRVQLFAQKLGTAISISAAKLEEQFRRIS
jgi:ATP-dependent helicase HrpA